MMHATICVASVCLSGGGFLVCERLLEENHVLPYMANLLDIDWLNSNTPEGRERSAEDFSHMLRTTGFHNIQIRKFPKYISYNPIFSTKP